MKEGGQAAYNANQVLPVVVFAGLMAWTIWYATKMRRRGREAAAARAAAASAAVRE